MNLAKVIIAGVLGFVIYLFSNVVIRRFDAKIRSREDYDADVDEKMTKAEKAAAAEEKKTEACKIKISFAGTKKENPIRVWIIAFLGMIFSGTSIYWFGLTGYGILSALFFLILTIIAFTDLDTMEIPPVLNIIIAVLGVAAIWLQPEITIVERIIGAASISVFLIIIDLIKSGAFGGGDIKLLFASGLFLGWKANVAGFFIGAIIGAVAGILLMIKKKKGREEHIPFGPSLCAGLIVASLFGNELINWYIEIIKMSMSH